jgi:hypothetical protein
MTSLATNVGKTLQISAQLENRIIHDFNNGGFTSSYGLNTFQRIQLLGLFLKGNAPKCECVECI